MSLKLDGKKLSLEIEERLSNYISSNIKNAKRAPGLAVIRICLLYTSPSPRD